MDFAALIHDNETAFSWHCSSINVNHTVALCQESLLGCVSMQHQSPRGPGLQLPLLCVRVHLSKPQSAVHTLQIFTSLRRSLGGRALSSGREGGWTPAVCFFRLHEYSKVKVSEYLRRAGNGLLHPELRRHRWNDALNVSSVTIVGFYDRDMDRSAANLSLNPSRRRKKKVIFSEDDTELWLINLRINKSSCQSVFLNMTGQ